MSWLEWIAVVGAILLASGCVLILSLANDPPPWRSRPIGNLGCSSVVGGAILIIAAIAGKVF